MAVNISDELNGLLYIPGELLVPNLAISIYIISALGVPANVLNFVVLSSREMRSSRMTCYLQFLAVFDGLFLFSWFISLNGIGNPFIYYFTCTTIAGSLYTTIGVSLERFIAVCFPLKAKTWLSYKRTLIHNIFIAFAAIFSNIPRYFTKEKYSYGNLEIIMYYTKRFGLQSFPDFVRDPDFDHALRYVWVRVVGMIFMQMLIAVFNVCIYRSVRKAEAMRREMSQSQMKDINVTKSILAVVAVYFCCWTPLTLYKIACYWAFVPRKIFFVLLYSNYVLSCLNSASNVIIYSAMRKDFRKAVFDIFVCRRKTRDNSVTPSTSV